MLSSLPIMLPLCPVNNKTREEPFQLDYSGLFGESKLFIATVVTQLPETLGQLLAIQDAEA